MIENKTQLIVALLSDILIYIFIPKKLSKMLTNFPD